MIRPVRFGLLASGVGCVPPALSLHDAQPSSVVSAPRLYHGPAEYLQIHGVRTTGDPVVISWDLRCDGRRGTDAPDTRRAVTTDALVHISDGDSVECPGIASDGCHRNSFLESRGSLDDCQLLAYQTGNPWVFWAQPISTFTGGVSRGWILQTPGAEELHRSIPGTLDGIRLRWTTEAGSTPQTYEFDTEFFANTWSLSGTNPLHLPSDNGTWSWTGDDPFQRTLKLESEGVSIEIEMFWWMEGMADWTALTPDSRDVVSEGSVEVF